MIWLILVRDASLRYHLCTFGTFRGKIMFITWHTIDLAIFGYEAFGADGRIACKTKKTILVKLLTLVLHFLHARLEYLSAFVATRSKRLIVAFATIERVVFGAERLVNERYLAYVTKETFLMPMLVLVRKVFRVGANFFLALFTIVSE